jgi:phosphate transport system protein
MTTLALRMLQQALDSFLREDEETALEICRRDRQVDELNTENYEGLVTELKRHDGNVDPRVLFELAFVSKSLERVGDHATNIAEEVVYLLSGREVRGKGEVQPR